MICSCASAVQTATQGSGSLARTVPLENAARNRAGMLSRFFASSECSKWPRNANAHVPEERVQTGVAEWEEPRHSGQLRGATVPHSLPLCNTIPHLSVRWRPAVWSGAPVFGSVEPNRRGGAWWDECPVRARFPARDGLLHAILRAERRFGGSRALCRN